MFYFVLENHLEEDDDHVEVNGVVFNKPFVEKPISAEDHNIYMYYPTSAGTNNSYITIFKSQSFTYKGVAIV